MRLPHLMETNETVRRQVVAVGGIHYSERAAEGELTDSVGLSSMHYPALGQRAERGPLDLSGYGAPYDAESYTPIFLYAHDKLLVLFDHGAGSSKSLFFGGSYVGELPWDSEAGELHCASIGVSVVFFPMGYCYDTKTGAFGPLGASANLGTGRVFANNAVTAASASVLSALRAGDAVEVSGCTTDPTNNKTAIIRNIAGAVLTFYDNTFAACTEAGNVTLTRKIPALRYVCEKNNRIWGVEGQTIYGSALGDPFNFFKFDSGLSTDSYAVSVGTPGAFTGVIPFGTHICFFKEDTLHKLFGTMPSNYETGSASVFGVQDGSAKSMQIINETLYYKGRHGVYAYTGGVPTLLSENFGPVRFGDATAGSDRERYYISMYGRGGWNLFAYDVVLGIWVRESGERVSDFAYLDGHLYLLDTDRQRIVTTNSKELERIAWMAEFAPFTETQNEKKGYSRIGLGVDLERGGWLEVEVNPDGRGWRNVTRTHDELALSATIPILPGRCSRFALRLSGEGRCKITNITRDFYVGSEA